MITFCSIDPAIIDLAIGPPISEGGKAQPRTGRTSEPPSVFAVPADCRRTVARNLLRRIANRHAICDPCSNETHGMRRRVQKLAEMDRPPYIHWKPCKRGGQYRECTTAGLPDSIALLLAIAGEERVQLGFVLSSTLEWLDKHTTVIPENITPYVAELRKKAVVVSAPSIDAGRLIINGPVALLENCGFLFSGADRDDDIRGFSIGCNLGGLSIAEFGSMLKSLYMLYPRVFFFDNGLLKDGVRVDPSYRTVCELLMNLGRGVSNFKMTFVGVCCDPSKQADINRRFTESVHAFAPQGIDVVGRNIHGQGWHDRFLLFAPKPQEQHEQPFVSLVFTGPLKAQSGLNHDRLFAGACILRCAGDDNQSTKELLSAFLAEVDPPPAVAPLQEV